MRAKDFIIEIKRAKKKKKKSKGKARRGLNRYFYPGFGYYGTTGSESSSDSGGGDGGGESIRESIQSRKDAVAKFALWAAKQLHLKRIPKIILSQDREEAQKGKHTGRHIVGADEVWVYAKNRNMIDILRTVFHELVHIRQEELNMVKPGSSYPGSPIEAMADMLAGKYIKIYGKQHPELFESKKKASRPIKLDELGQYKVPYSKTTDVPRLKKFDATLGPSGPRVTISFFLQDFGKSIEIEFSVDSRKEVTGKGNQFKILSHVLNVIKNELPNVVKKNTQYINIYSDIDEKSRVSLYSKAVPLMTTVIKDALGKDWVYDRETEGAALYGWHWEKPI